MNTVVTPRPSMSLGFLELLDRTFRIYRDNFFPMIGLVALITIPLTIFTTYIAPQFTNTRTGSPFSTNAVSNENLAAQCFSAAVVFFAALVQVVILNGVLSYMASESQMGRKVSLGEAFRGTRRRFTNLGCGFLVAGAVLFVMVLPILFLSNICGLAIAGLGLVAYVAIAMYALVTPVLTLENVRASEGVNRAWTLGRARFWTLFGIIVVIYVLSLILTLALTLVFQYVGTPIFGNTFTGLRTMNTVMNVIIGIIITPISPIAMTLLYYDVRSRVEGLDLALAALDKPDPRPSDVMSPSAGPLFTGRDFINVVILTVGAVVLTLVAGSALREIANNLAPGLGGAF